MHIAVGFALLLAIAAAPAQADLIASINALRAQGCGGKPGVQAPLRPQAQLDAAAQRVSRGGELREAVSASGYRATKWASITVAGTAADDAIMRVIEQQHCTYVLDKAFRDIGVYRRDASTWIVLAAPFSAPGPGDARAISKRVLELVNQARSRARQCGNKEFAAAAPLKLAPALERAAAAHAQDMAARNYFSHDGRNGSTVSERVSRAGYAWRAVGENIAAGPATPEAVVKGWLASPGHCANSMSADYTEMGVAYAVNPSSTAGIYWVQVFAAPR